MIQQRVFIIEQYFKNNKSLDMKHIFTSMALLIAKIANCVRRREISEEQMHLVRILKAEGIILCTLRFA